MPSPTIEIRLLAEEELELDDEVHGQCFERGDRSEIEARKGWRRLNSHRLANFGLWDAAGLQATFQVVSYQAHLGPETIVPLGYLSYVACLPAARGRGYAGACLVHALEHMRQNGQFLSHLSPFDFDFYRRYGWEWIGVNRRYTVPTRALRPDPGTAHVRAAAREDWPRIRSIYTRFARGYRGMIARDDQQWNALLAGDDRYFAYTYIYENAGCAEGYLVYTGERLRGEETVVNEFICLTPAAQAALLGLMRRHEMQTAQVSWDAPGDDGLWSRGYDKAIRTSLTPVIQGRVVDLAGALRAWKPGPAARGSLALGIHDEHAPWNAGVWQIEFEGGSVSVEPAHRQPGVIMDVQALSQAFFGTPALDALRTQDRLRVEEESGYEALRALLAGPPMWSAGE